MCAYIFIGFPGGANGKELTRQYRRHKKHGFYPWVGKIPRGGNGNPLQYSCQENPVDKGAWHVAVHGVAKRWIRWSDFFFTSMIFEK